MNYLWSQWSKVGERIRRSRHLLLLLDYDGTLAPIAPEPEEARLPPATKSVLRRLSHSPKVSVALISGRALSDLRRLVGLRNLTYVGNHGLEIQRYGIRKVVRVIPNAYRAAMSLIRPRLSTMVAGVPGSHLEDKGLSLSLHYRLVHRDQVRRLRAAFRREVLPFVRSGTLTVLTGKKVIEVRPSLNWTKGHAVRWLLRRMRRRSVLSIYIGDDRTDEDAFAVLIRGITIRVGAHRPSKAQYYVRGTREVFSFLEMMADRSA